MAELRATRADRGPTLGELRTEQISGNTYVAGDTNGVVRIDKAVGRQLDWIGSGK